MWFCYSKLGLFCYLTRLSIEPGRWISVGKISLTSLIMIDGFVDDLVNDNILRVTLPSLGLFLLYAIFYI